MARLSSTPHVVLASGSPAFKLFDIIPLFEGVQDPLIPKFTRIPANYQMANAEHYVRERSPNGFTMQTEIQLVLEYEGKFAGGISFHTLVLDEAKAEIGYWLTADARGNGIHSFPTRRSSDDRKSVV